MIVFIVNSVSGNGKGLKVWPVLEKRLQRKGVPYEMHRTERPGHAEELAAAAAGDGIQTVVAVGGDGTVHEVVNGLAGFDTVMGYIPAGSGNDFARAHGIPQDPLLALDRILDGRVSIRDTARVSGSGAAGIRMASTAGIGFDGSVARTVNRSPLKKWLGKLIYVLGVFQVLFRYAPATVTLRLDGEEKRFEKVWLIAVANIAYYGGGMKICPEASNRDGLLDICVVEGISKGMLLLMFPRVFLGNHVRHPEVHLFQARRIAIESDRQLVVHIDGEIKGNTPLEIDVTPASLRVL